MKLQTVMTWLTPVCRRWNARWIGAGLQSLNGHQRLANVDADFQITVATKLSLRILMLLLSTLVFPRLCSSPIRSQHFLPQMTKRYIDYIRSSKNIFHSWSSLLVLKVGSILVLGSSENIFMPMFNGLERQFRIKASMHTSGLNVTHNSTRIAINYLNCKRPNISIECPDDSTWRMQNRNYTNASDLFFKLS